MLHLIFEEAVNGDRLLRNPCRKIILPELDQDDTAEEQRIFTPGELEALYDAL